MTPNIDLVYGSLLIGVGLAPLAYVSFLFLRAAYRYDPRESRRAGDLLAGTYRLLIAGLALALCGLALVTR